ncbi:hypothetical protein [Lentibacillus amyloliquefaciens]|uniref:Uncharacterized protein n=1 Tax=Lentibacillus amyloliquefaciens TaxID=1472767 RepID=A0A0U3WCI3_9BACI|nr:hypothetical protein [Lentibacillus amyloliquefaciens]ALX47503.1 hypothetical protein AOX59_02130 [Lentibacillus amyloliquefaciens]
MDLFISLIVLYFAIGLLIYFSTIKGVRRKIAFVKTDTESQEGSKSVVWWIVGLTIWGVVGILLIVSWFLINVG